MIRRKEILVSLILCVSVALSGCNRSGEQKPEETTSKPETVETEKSADDSSTSESEKETTTESSSESETENSSEEESATASSALAENLSPDEMEAAFLQYCDDNGIQYFKSEENGSIRYECKDYLFVFRRFPDSASAENAYKEVLNYGGWYEEDLVTREVLVDEPDRVLKAYYCQAEDGMTMLFILERMDNLFISVEAIGEEKVKNAEGILQAIGVNLAPQD